MVDDQIDDLKKSLSTKCTCLLNFVGSEKGWCDSLFENQFAVLDSGYEAVQVTPGCVGDVLLCLEGKVHVFGIPFKSCPGDKYADKRENLVRAQKSTLAELVSKRGGFVVTLTKNHLFAVPPCFITITRVASSGIDAEDAELLRWGYYCKDWPLEGHTIMHECLSVILEDMEGADDATALQSWADYALFELGSD